MSREGYLQSGSGSGNRSREPVPSKLDLGAPWRHSSRRPALQPDAFDLLRFDQSAQQRRDDHAAFRRHVRDQFQPTDVASISLVRSRLLFIVRMTNHQLTRRSQDQIHSGCRSRTDIRKRNAIGSSSSCTASYPSARMHPLVAHHVSVCRTPSFEQPSALPVVQLDDFAILEPARHLHAFGQR